MGDLIKFTQFFIDFFFTFLCGVWRKQNRLWNCSHLFIKFKLTAMNWNLVQSSVCYLHSDSDQLLLHCIISWKNYNEATVRGLLLKFQFFQNFFSPAHHSCSAVLRAHDKAYLALYRTNNYSFFCHESSAAGNSIRWMKKISALHKMSFHISKEKLKCYTAVRKIRNLQPTFPFY